MASSQNSALKKSVPLHRSLISKMPLNSQPEGFSTLLWKAVPIPERRQVCPSEGGHKIKDNPRAGKPCSAFPCWDKILNLKEEQFIVSQFQRFLLWLAGSKAEASGEKGVGEETCSSRGSQEANSGEKAERERQRQKQTRDRQR